MLEWIDIVLREMLMFASFCLFIGGIDDLVIDLIWIMRSAWRRLVLFRKYDPGTMENLPPPDQPGRMAILIAAWAEAAVIGSMLRAALACIDHADYRIFVGTYRNDPATSEAVALIAQQDPRVRLVEGIVDGPTTKGECLNRIWAALEEDEFRQGVRYKAIVIHDAEDVIHSAELRLFDRLIERFDLVQLPVLPFKNARSRWVAGHYCDEFAEAHDRQMVVREALGAGIPSAGVGCAISREAMGRMAAIGAGSPFDETSLTEDYEIGLRLADIGHGGAFVTLPVSRGGKLVAVRAHFPATVGTAVRQKTRWMIGIALAGWDRLGWRAHWADIWMRLRDRRALLAAFVLGVAYAALALWAISATAHFVTGVPRAELPPFLVILLKINAGLLAWRALMRFLSVRRFYDTPEAIRAVLRIIPSNIIAMMAARRAIIQYWRMLRGKPLRWDKTAHIFPESLPAE